MTDTITVALIGNPNTGKSTLFSALVGMRQRVGNYPGVTVEEKIGRMEIHGRPYIVIDLPGTYSLAPRSPDEMIVVDVLLGRHVATGAPDVMLCIVDASNLERNLYLLSQVRELRRPVVVALNMGDIAAVKGMTLDVDLLRERLGVPVVEIQANRKIGLADLKRALADAGSAECEPPPSPFPAEFQREVAALERKQGVDGRLPLPRCLVERLLLDSSGYLEAALLPGLGSFMPAELKAARERLAVAGFPVPGVEAMARYRWAGDVLAGVVARPAIRPVTMTDRIDRVLTHRLWGFLVFVAVMAGLFQSVFYVAEPASDAIRAVEVGASGLAESLLPEGALRSLLVEGVLGGVGGVLVFLPQIFTLFLFIALLEDCGYMARAAYLMDNVMFRVGLNGQSFIPLLSSFACAIPGIMSARVIQDPRDRLATIVIAPLMSCSARLAVFTLLAGAIIPDVRCCGGVVGLQGLTILAMYLLGIVTAIVVALVLKKTLLRTAVSPFVMELPSYKAPSAAVVLHRMLERGWAFVRQAGTLIFAVTVVIWAAAYYPHNPHSIPAGVRRQRADLQREIARWGQIDGEGGPRAASQDRIQALHGELKRVDGEIAGAYLRHSFLGRAGRLIEPVVRPLGWDWRIGCAVIASFPAREVVIATLGVIYNLDEDGRDGMGLRETLRAARRDGTNLPVLNTPVALSLMVFFALCAQCISTLAVMRRETNSWRWPLFTFVYMTVLAYLGAMGAYQAGMFVLGRWG